MAIKPYNYSDPQSNAVSVGNKSAIAPFNYEIVPEKKISPIEDTSIFKDNSKLGILKNTVKGLADPRNLPLGVGTIVKQAQDDPETVYNTNFEDVLQGVVDTSKGTYKGLITAGANFVPKELKFDVPGLGEVTNRQFNAAQRIRNGEDPLAATVDEGTGAIFDTLMIVGLASEVAGVRPTVIAKGNIPEGITTKTAPRSFRMYEEPVATQTLTPEFVQKMAESQGVDLGPSYDPSLPTYFKMTGKASGKLTGEVVQIKPSYLDTFFNALRGNTSKVPGTEVIPLISKSVSTAELKSIMPTKIVPPTQSVDGQIKIAEQPAEVIKFNPSAPNNSTEVASNASKNIKTTFADQNTISENVSPEVQAKAEADWEDNYAEAAGTRASEISDLQKQVREVGAKERPAIQTKLDLVLKEDAKIENEFLDKWKTIDGIRQDNLSGKTFKVSKEILKPKSVEKTTYHIRNDSGKGIEFIPVDGKRVEIVPNVHTFIHKSGSGWVVSEATSGLKMADGKTRALAIKNAQEATQEGVKKAGTTIEKIIEGAVKKHGLSPSFGGEKTVKTGEQTVKKYETPTKLPPTPPEKRESSIQLNSGLDPGLGKTLEEDIIPKAKGLFAASKSIYNEIATVFNPIGQAPKAGVDILMRNKGNFEKETFRTEQATKKIKTMWEKQPEPARLKFMAKVENGTPLTAEDFNGFEDLAKMYRERLDNAHRAVSQFKEIPFLDNFFPHFWEKPSEITKNFMGKVFAKKPLQGSKSFLKHRVFESIQEGIDAGYKPVSTNPEELVQIYETNVRKFIMAQQIKADMIGKGLWKFVKQGQQAPEDFARIDDAIARIYYKPQEINSVVQAGEYYAQKDVARLINNYLSKDRLMDTALGKGIMNVKNTLNAFQLGFSAFHLTMETLDTVTTKISIGISEIATGNVIKGLKDIVTAPLAPYSFFRQGQKFFSGDPVLSNIEDAIFTGGASFREKQYYKNTVLDTFVKNVQGGNYLGALVRLPLAAIEATMRPLFGYYIPRLKVGAFRELYGSELERLSQDIQDGKTTQEEVARNTWNNIENRMGELNYDNLFWNRNLKTALMLSFRAVGWNLGTIRELGGGLLQDTPREFAKLFKGQSKDFNFTPKMSYTLSLFLLMGALGAIYQYLHTGKKPEGVKDLYYPRNGAKDKSGEDYRVEFPSYLKDLYQVSHNPIKTVGNKTAPEFSLLINLLTNKNFYGDYIRNENDNLPTQAKQTALFLASQLTPFTVQNLSQLNAGKADVEQKIEAFFGIIKAPKEVIQNEYQKQLYELYREQAGELGARTPEQVKIAELKTQAREAIKNGDLSILRQMIKDGIITQKGASTFIKNAKLTSDERLFKSLKKSSKAELQKVLPLEQ